jgi:demethylmenaquinone methyltransferase/2-methoxy-6-polyprenyl-1,4-benzoquinol methylase
MALSPGLPPDDDKRAVVEAMFDRIAPHYDRMNRLLSVGLDQRWRARAVALAGVAPGDLVVDVACGTGDLAELAAARGARVVAVDVAREMLRGARRRGVAARFARADVERLPLADGAAAAVVCGFALRNFVGLAPAFAEMARVLRPGGRLVLIEVDRPETAWVRRLHGLWFDRAVPRLGAWLADAEAYAYLPRSTAYLPPAPRVRALLEASGFEGVARQRLLLGAAQILSARRAGGPA